MPAPLIVPVVAVAHSAGGFIAAKVTSTGLVYIAGTTAATASASLVAGTAAVQTAFVTYLAVAGTAIAGTTATVVSFWPF